MTVFDSLRDVKILDLTVNIAGPFASQILADLGAVVLKIEHPEKGDDSRHMPPVDGDQSAVFSMINRGKSSIAANLKDPAQRRAVLELGDSCDVVLESFRPGKAQAMGLGYEDFRLRNPSVIYCSISAFGSHGEGANLPGYDPLIQAFCGIMAATGQPGDKPTRVAPSIIDLSTGMWAAIGLVAAVLEKKNTGEGQHLEVSLLDTGFMLMCHQIGTYLLDGTVPEPQGSASPLTAPYEAFLTSNGWVMIAAGNDRLFAKLCVTLGLEEVLGDGRFRTVADRVLRRSELHEILEARLMTESKEVWLERFGDDIPIGIVQGLDEAPAHPITKEREILLDPIGSSEPRYQYVRLPIISDGHVAPRGTKAPGLGDDTDDYLAHIKER